MSGLRTRVENVLEQLTKLVSPASADREQERLARSYLERKEAHARLEALRARAGIRNEEEE